IPCAGSLEQLGQFAHDELALAAIANGLCANSLERSRPATQTDVRAPPARPDTASLRAASHPTLPTYHEAPSSDQVRRELVRADHHRRHTLDVREPELRGD